MARVPTALSVSLMALSALAPSLLVAPPAAAGVLSQSEAHRRLDFLRSVTGHLSWLCVMRPIGGGGPDVNVAMDLSVSPDLGASAITTSTATMDGRTYSAVYRLVGQARAHLDGRATVDLDQSRMVRADALPNGLNWSDTSSVRLSFEIVPDSVTSGRYRYMLSGRQSDDFGGSTINCGVYAGG